MLKLSTYRLVDSCALCKFAFQKFDHDEGITYYCRRKAPRRPKCGSVSMGEMWHGRRYDPKKFDKGMRDWQRWSKDREVQPHGYCFGYRMKKVQP